MTTHCANPACGTRFPRDIEYFWLCGSCSPRMRISLDADGNVVLEQLETAASSSNKIVAAATEEPSAKKRFPA